MKQCIARMAQEIQAIMLPRRLSGSRCSSSHRFAIGLTTTVKNAVETLKIQSRDDYPENNPSLAVLLSMARARIYLNSRSIIMYCFPLVI